MKSPSVAAQAAPISPPAGAAGSVEEPRGAALPVERPSNTASHGVATDTGPSSSATAGCSPEDGIAAGWVLLGIVAIVILLGIAVASSHVRGSSRHSQAAQKSQSEPAAPSTAGLALASPLTSEPSVLPPIVPFPASTPPADASVPGSEAAPVATAPDPGAATQAAANADASPTPAPQSSSFTAGQSVKVATSVGNDCANVRKTPALSGEIVHCLPAGTAAQVSDGPREADGHRWWMLDAGGWMAEDYLVGGNGPQTAATGGDNSVAAALARALLSTYAQGLSTSSQGPLAGYAGYATYYGIEDGFVRGDIMNDGVPFDPADPTIAAASFLIPMHTWLRVCTSVRCILVQVQDRGLLDQNGILLDLSRGAYALLFGGLGGKQWISAYFAQPATATP